MLNGTEYLKGKALAIELINLYREANGKLHEDSRTVNFKKLNKIIIKPISENKELIKKFNDLYKRINNSKSFTELVRTKSKGISINKQTLLERPFQFDVRKTSINATITFVTNVGCGKIVCGYDKKKGKDSDYFGTGGTCSNKIIEIAENNSIDMSKYEFSVTEGREIAEKITKPANKNYAIQDKIYENVHHLDFHKFYPSGIIECYPEFEKVFEECLKIKGGKQIIDAGTRYWASEAGNYRYAKLISDGIKTAYVKLWKVFDELMDSGRKPLMINTDGIWYQGEIFHGIYEGDGFGEWSNDYINCKWRTKTTSTGCYEFIGTDTETGETKYFPKVKGTTTYEAIKPRDKWEWGDIYKGYVIKCEWDDIEGFIVDFHDDYGYGEEIF